MKKIRKYLFLSLSVCLISINSFNVFAYEKPVSYQYNEFENTTKYPIYEWRYKTENGKLYKREFNMTTNEWAGDWIYVCDVE